MTEFMTMQHSSLTADGICQPYICIYNKWTSTCEEYILGHRYIICRQQEAYL